MNKILLIDGNSLFFRSFYANQGTTLNVNGVPTNGVYTFANLLLTFLRDNDYYDVRVAFDKGKQTFRHQMYDQYKDGRQKTPQELIAQLPIVREFMDATGIGYLEMDEFEADDIVGSFAVKASSEGFDVHVLSSDRDLWQLVSSRITVLSPISGIKEYATVDTEYIYNKYQITPKQIIDLKAIMGDNSDNIKGIPGIGEVGAKKLLAEYGTLEEIYKNIENIQGATKTKLIAGEESAFFAKKLVALRTDIDFNNSKFSKFELNVGALQDFFLKYQMVSLSKKFCGDVAKPEVINFEYVSSFDNVIFKDKNYIFIEILNDDYHNPNIIGVGLSNSANTYYVNVENANVDIFNWDKFDISKHFQSVLLDEKTEFATYDVKKTIFALEKLGYKVNYDQFTFDTKSALYVLNPEAGLTPEKQLLILETNVFLDSDEDVFGRGVKRTANIDSSVKRSYIARKTHILSSVTNEITARLKKYDQYELYFKIDHPLNFVLLEMEREGVAIDKSELKNQTANIENMIKNLEREISISLGSDYPNKLNIGSPKQLKTLLFETLKLPDRHKGSTDKEALDDLAGEHPVVELIIKHRKLSKLFTTYLNGFNKYIKNGKIHTKFNQSLTATGRLSSSDPNLQNISIRDELQKQVRKIFVVSKPENIFIGLDYSQIELRVLAQMAKEKHMVEMFQNGQDIHEEAARKIFKLSGEENVTSEMRRVAKVFNFGIVYGLSDFGLARDLKISVPKAKEFIDSYFETFSDLKRFKDQLIIDARENESAITLSKRKRNIQQLSNSNYQLRSFGERIAVNMPIQGTAADIIKVAMINIWNRIRKEHLSAAMIAQIHDELILEVKRDDLPIVKELVTKEMQRALQAMLDLLNIEDKVVVKLEVSYSEGNNWLELK